MTKPNFSWRNYSAATPQNYLRLAKLVKRILYGLSTASLLQESHWVTLITILLIPTTEELVQFFSDASIDANAINVEPQVLEKGMTIEQPVTIIPDKSKPI